MAESKQTLRMKILDELENCVRGRFVHPTMTTQERVEAEKAKLQEICDMAYDGGLSDAKYVVDVEYHEETGTAEFILTKAAPFDALSLHFELDKGVVE